MAVSQTTEHSSSEELLAEAHAETHSGRGSRAAKGTRGPEDECVAAGGPMESEDHPAKDGNAEDCGARRGTSRYEGDKAEWAEASGAPPEAAEKCGAAREADKANGARLGAAEDSGGMNISGGMWRHMKAIGGLSDYTQVSKSLTNMEGKRLLRLPARVSQSLRLLGVTSSHYRMGLWASNSSRAGQGA